MSHSDERIAALEAQLATLESRVTEGGTRPAAYDRRALLRRGGAVLAGAAGVMALPGMIDGASAASGGTFTLGAANDAGANQTTLTANSTTQAATLLVAATNEISTPSTTTATAVSYGSPQLNLVPAVPYTDSGAGATKGTLVGPFSPNPATTKTGDLFASTATTTGANAIASDLVYTHSGAFKDSSGNPFSAVLGAVYTSAFHNVLVPIVDNNTGTGTSLPAARVLNTSTTTKTYKTVNPSTGATATPAGSTTPLAANTVVRVEFTPGQTSPPSFLTAGGALYAVGGNLTVTQTTNAAGGTGFVSAVAQAKATDISGNPKTANLLLPGNNGGASNFCIIPCSANVDSNGNVINYFFDLVLKSGSAQLIFDVTALFVSDTTDVVLTAQPGYSASSASAKAQRARIAR